MRKTAHLWSKKAENATSRAVDSRRCWGRPIDRDDALFERDRKPRGAFFVAHIEDVGWTGTIDGIGSARPQWLAPNQPLQNRADRKPGPDWDDLAAIPWRPRMGRLRRMRALRSARRGGRSRENPLARSGFPPFPQVGRERSNWSFATAKAFVIRRPAREHLFRLFPDSSAVEHSTVNRMVAGSNPAPGAIRFCPPLYSIDCTAFRWRWRLWRGI